MQPEGINTTFGLDFPACKSIDRILLMLDAQHHKKRVYKLIDRLLRRTKSLRGVEHKNHFIELEMQHTVMAVKHSGFPTVLETHVLCILTAICRKEMNATRAELMLDKTSKVCYNVFDLESI